MKCSRPFSKRGAYTASDNALARNRVRPRETSVREVGNRHDPYAIAVKKDGLVVGHLPCKISYTCSIFIR